MPSVTGFDAGEMPTPGKGGQPNGQAGDVSQVRELFWNGPGARNIKDGKAVGAGFVDGHEDHVHLASQNRAYMMRAAKVAQKMGLSVREFSPIDPVDPVHSPTSWHYRDGGDDAMDVSGARMKAFARRVAAGRI
jgi:hypothetical protein